MEQYYNATEVANETENVAIEATSSNKFNSNCMEEEKVIATDVAQETVADATIESVNAADNAASTNQNPDNMERKNEEVAQTTRIAIINGEEVSIIVAHTEYGMELPKDKKKLIESIDQNKMLNCIYHLATPEIFWEAGIKLLDEENNPIEKSTENVFVLCPTADTYWRIAVDGKLNSVEIHTFKSVEEYAQAIGCTNLYSRGLNNVEKMGIAALATGDEACQTVFQFAKEHNMSVSTAQHYLDYSIKPTAVLGLMIGFQTNNVPTLGRTIEEAKALLGVVKSKFEKNAEKRYIIRPINTLLHMVNKDYSLDLMKEALKSLSEMDTNTIENALNGQREAMVSSTLTTHLDKLKSDQKEAA